MAEAAQGTQQEFWRPPSHPLGQEVVVSEAIPTMAEACPRCGSEFLLGSRFCHTCGGRRPEVITATNQDDAAAIANVWEGYIHQAQSFLEGFSWRKVKFPTWLGYLHFHAIKEWIGLPTGSLIAFVIGIACVAGALLVGLLTAKTLVDWQAIQIYRVEWLLGATASFVLGILLKKSDRDDRD